MDLTGSGNETAAHMLADGRLTIMFCASRARPRYRVSMVTGGCCGGELPEYADLLAGAFRGGEPLGARHIVGSASISSRRPAGSESLFRLCGRAAESSALGGGKGGSRSPRPIGWRKHAQHRSSPDRARGSARRIRGLGLNWPSAAKGQQIPKHSATDRVEFISALVGNRWKLVRHRR